MGAGQTHTQTVSKSDTVGFLDNMTLGELDQPCSKRIRADLEDPELVGAQGTEDSLAFEGFQRGESFGFEPGIGGGTQVPDHEVKDKVEDQKVIAQINTGGLGQQGLITDY